MITATLSYNALRRKTVFCFEEADCFERAGLPTVSDCLNCEGADRAIGISVNAAFVVRVSHITEYSLFVSKRFQALL
jgi:hypothetical protein